MSTATFEEFSGQKRSGMLDQTLTTLNSVYYDKFGHYIYLHDTKEVLTMHEWIRTLDLNDKFYFGGVADYHW